MIKNSTIKFNYTLFLPIRNSFVLLLEKLFLEFEYFTKIIFQIVTTSSIKLPIIYANIRV